MGGVGAADCRRRRDRSNGVNARTQQVKTGSREWGSEVCSRAAAKEGSGARHQAMQQTDEGWDLGCFACAAS